MGWFSSNKSNEESYNGLKCTGCGKEVTSCSSFPQPTAPKGDFCDDCAEPIIKKLIDEGNWESW